MSDCIAVFSAFFFRKSLLKTNRNSFESLLSFLPPFSHFIFNLKHKTQFSRARVCGNAFRRQVGWMAGGQVSRKLGRKSGSKQTCKQASRYRFRQARQQVWIQASGQEGRKVGRQGNRYGFRHAQAGRVDIGGYVNHR